MRKRIIEALPTHAEIKPFLGSFGIALLRIIPLATANTAGIVLISEKMKKNPDLIPLGIAAYAIFSLISAVVDYYNLKNGRVAGSAKANTLYRGLTFLFPQKHEFNAISAEIGTVLLNAVGVNPDPTAPISSIISVLTRDPTIAVAQRVSDMAISLVTQLPYNIYLYSRNKRKKNY